MYINSKPPAASLCYCFLFKSPKTGFHIYGNALVTELTSVTIWLCPASLLMIMHFTFCQLNVHIDILDLRLVTQRDSKAAKRL